MKYGMLSLASPIHEKNRVRETINRLLADLREKLDIEEISPERFGRVEFPLICLLTGGTEHEFRELYPRIVADGRPITLLTLPHSNSLPAGLEILAWLNAQGAKTARLLHGDTGELAAKIDLRGKGLTLVRALRESVVGVVGAPSDWLIASSVNATLFRQRLGLSIKEIPIGEVHDAWEMITDQDMAGGFQGLPKSGTWVEPSDNDRERALKLYIAMRRLVAGHGLSAVTLRCFDLLQKLGTSGCVALSRLNDEGVTAGCEGDVPALITMHIHRLLSGEASF
ncbi:MAG TPA: hypothetical protein PKM25_11950, partial [Candidatus Ozemobacteraceae bacterium]|nr:hypothetical protein [Candidatus Ozemobacteraceae bacterium]